MPGIDFANEDCFYFLITGNCINEDCLMKHPQPKVKTTKKLKLQKNVKSFTPTVEAPPKKELKTKSTSFNPDQSFTPQPQNSSNNLMSSLSGGNPQGGNHLINNMTPQQNHNQMQMAMNMGMGDMGYNPNNFYQKPNAQMNNFYQNQMMIEQQRQQMMQMQMQEQYYQQQMMGHQLDLMMGIGEEVDEDYDDEEHNENEFVEECANCTCCNGYPYRCISDQMCREMGQCFCVMQMETEKNIQHNENFFAKNMKDCECCHGYIYNCKSEVCRKLDVCHCVIRTEMEEPDF